MDAEGEVRPQSGAEHAVVALIRHHHPEALEEAGQ
jgi:hypothetical protein